MVLAIDCIGNYKLVQQLEQAADKGATIVLLQSGKQQKKNLPFIYREMHTEDVEDFLSQIAKTLIQIGCGTGLAGYRELVNALEDVEVTEDAMHMAIMYQLSENAKILCGSGTMTRNIYAWIKVLELLSGHTCSCQMTEERTEKIQMKKRRAC